MNRARLLQPTHGCPVVAVLGVMIGAPLSAEYLQAYLPDTGDLMVMVGGLVVLGPLYGGAALLIREVAVRTSLGWRGIALLAAAFGLLMTSQVDGSMWLVEDPEIPYWTALRSGTLIEPLGFAAFPVASWIMGHVIFSIGAPLALLDALSPNLRGRPLLRRVGIIFVACGCLAGALLIRADPEYASVDETMYRSWWTFLVAAGLAGLAFTPWGAPVRRADHARPSPRPWRVLGGSMAVLACLDLLPATWVGLAVYVLLTCAAGLILWCVARTHRWTPTHVMAIGVAAVVERVALGLVSPLPDGVTLLAKTAQSIVLVLLVLVVVVAAWRRSSVPSQRK